MIAKGVADAAPIEKKGLKMEFYLRIDEANLRHVHCTLFANGANCGRLTMTGAEYLAFGILLKAGDNLGGIKVKVDLPPTARVSE